MFEGRIKPKSYDKGGERPVLREVRWTDLVARLEASRDFRETDFKPCEAGFASFASVRSAEQEQPVTEKDADVNHDALSHGKARIVSGGPTAADAAKSDREKL